MLGTLLLIHDREVPVRALDFHGFESRMRRLLRVPHGAEGNGLAVEDRGPPTPIRRAISDYFSGDLCAVNSIPVTTGGTSFQREVWAALRTIEAGTTLSYGALARRLVRPKSVRAVGSANGANPVAIVVPCHRVIGADGSLTGYGGGISRKRWLLTHEGVASLSRPVASLGLITSCRHPSLLFFASAIYATPGSCFSSTSAESHLIMG